MVLIFKINFYANFELIIRVKHLDSRCFARRKFKPANSQC